MHTILQRVFRLAIAPILVLALLSTVAGGGPWASDALAQGQEGAGRQGPGGRFGPGRRQLGPDGGSSPVELQELLDAMVLVQAERSLELSGEQFAQFLTRLKALQAVRRRAGNQRNRAVMELRRVVQAGNAAGGGVPPDEVQIRERLKTLDDAEAQGLIEIKQARSSLDQILNTRQQARFRLLEEQIERRKLELFARSRQAAPPK